MQDFVYGGQKKGWDFRRAANLGKWPEMIQGPKS